MMNETWLPAYVREGRELTREWVNNHIPDPKKWMWGNTPSFDLLNLKNNEGLEYDKDMNLLFAGKHSNH
jgi:hypothetical protein